MSSLPNKPFRCVICKSLFEQPKNRCPECGQAGGVMVRENLDVDLSSQADRYPADTKSYRCITCGNVMDRPHKECPRCHERSIAPFERTKSANDGTITMLLSRL